MNNKGQMSNFNILLGFFILVAIIMVAGFFIIIVSAVINMFADEIVPEIESIGMVGESNVTQYAEYTLTPLNNLVQSFTWITGFVYAIAIIGLIGFAVMFNVSMNRLYIGFYFIFALLMIILSIVISNMYQDLWYGTNELALLLQEHTLLSYMILHSPVIFTVIIFISGIILFSGMGRENDGGGI